jgi:type I restriction enzyme, S subunit
MEIDWTQAKLGDYIDSCLGKMLDKNKNTGEYHPYLGNSNVRWGEFELDDLAEMKFEAHEHTRYGLKKGDLIICEGGEPGRCAIWEDEIPNMKIQKALHRVRTLSGLDSEYLYYWFLFSARAGHIEPFFTGTTIKHLTGKALKEIPIRIPPLTYQQHGAKLLRGIDNKITLNRQINQTLEQMAQALFKSWFVDFDPVVDNALDAGFFEQDLEFPDELLRRAEVRKAVLESAYFKPLPEDILKLFPTTFEECAEPLFGLGGWIPRGWGVSELNELIDIKHGFAFKGEYFSDKETDEVLLTPGNVKVGGGFKSEKYKFYAGPIEANYIFSSGDIFVTMTDLSKASDTLGYPAIVPEIIEKRFHHNQRLGKVIYREHPASYPMFIYHTLCSASYRQSVLGSATGTTVKHTSPKKILCHRLVNSLNGLVEAEFERLVASYNLMASVNNKASLTLTRLRDTLLPKLISGELRLSDSEVDTADEVLA